MVRITSLAAVTALLSSILVAGQARGASIPMDDLQMWLRADAGVITEDSTYAPGSVVTTWLDQSGKGNNASESGTARPTLVSNGVNGKLVLNFDGVDDRLRVLDNTGLDGGDGQTLFVYFKPTSFSGPPELVAKWDYHSQGSYAYELTGSGALFGFVAVPGDGGSNYRISSGTVSSTSYNAVSVLYDGTQATNAARLKFFNNGVYLGDSSGGGTISSTMLDSGSPLTIGSFPNLGRFFTGQIAEVILYNRALSPEESQQVVEYLDAHWTPEPTSLALLGLAAPLLLRRRARAE